MYYCITHLLKGSEEITGLVEEYEADFRVIVDPIDGTGNFSKGLRSNLSENESGFGWGSMIAIQEKNKSHWKTVASGIYESCFLDKPEKLHGTIYIATEDFAGVRIFNFSNESESVLQTLMLYKGSAKNGFALKGKISLILPSSKAKNLRYNLEFNISVFKDCIFNNRFHSIL